MLEFLSRLWTRRKHTQASSAPGNGADATLLSDQLETARQALVDGDTQSAIVMLERLTDSHADAVEAWYMLGDALHRVGRHDDALDALQTGLAHDPVHAPMHHLLGLVYVRRGDVIKAQDALATAARLAPRSSAILSDLGYLLLTQLDQAQAALAVLDLALQREPGLQTAGCNRAAALAALGHTEEALKQYDALLVCDPNDPEVRFNRSIALLTLGRYSEAWPDYELRRTTSPLFTRRICPLPEWDGRKLDGKRLLVLAEQGLGDEIMFASCFDELAAYADAQLVLDCSPKLGTLFARSFPAHIVRPAPQDAPLDWVLADPELVAWVYAGSVPRRFRTRPEEFPRHAGYLRADPERVAAWRARLQSGQNVPAIGISWRGGMPQTRRSARSIEPASLVRALGMPGVALVDLQYPAPPGLQSSELQLPSQLTCYPEALVDYDETAALVMALDGVVSVCTALVHLAGALGKPACVLTPYAAEWRYAKTGETMPWYPEIRLLRQSTPGDWTVPLTRALELIRSQLESV